MKFIRGDKQSYFNIAQILAFTIEQCYEDDGVYYTVNIIPVRATYNAENYVIKSFKRAYDAEKYLETIIYNINMEADT